MFNIKCNFDFCFFKTVEDCVPQKLLGGSSQHFPILWMLNRKMGSPKTQLQSRIPLNSVPAKRLPDQGLALPQTCCKVNPTWPGLYIRQMQMCLNKAHCAFLGLQQGRGCNLQLGNCQERNTFQLLTSTGVTSPHCFVSLIEEFGTTYK